VRGLELPENHCYRCGNSWTPWARVVRNRPRCRSRYWEDPKLRVPKGGGGLGVEGVLGPYRARINRIARRYHARGIRVFGSLARNSATATSDIDFLVDFDRSRATRPNLRSVDFALELEKLLGRHVEVATESSLHWFIQPQVVTEAVPL
jgi:predicted nucleotidyltransferase